MVLLHLGIKPNCKNKIIIKEYPLASDKSVKIIFCFETVNQNKNIF